MLDTDQDGILTIDEFKVLLQTAESAEEVEDGEGQEAEDGEEYQEAEDGEEEQNVEVNQ